MKMISSLAIVKSLGAVSFFIEDGANGLGELVKIITELRKSGKFKDRYQIVSGDTYLVQTADVMAYETIKRIKDRVDTARKLRKSLQSLIGGNNSHRIVALDKHVIEMIPELLADGTHGE